MVPFSNTAAVSSERHRAPGREAPRFRQPRMTGTPSLTSAPATRVSTVPIVNDRQHRRHQADQGLAALTLRALGILRGFHGFARLVGWAPRSRCPFVGRADPGSRFGDQWLLLTRVCREPAAVAWRLHDLRA